MQSTSGCDCSPDFGYWFQSESNRVLIASTNDFPPQSSAKSAIDWKRDLYDAQQVEQEKNRLSEASYVHLVCLITIRHLRSMHVSDFDWYVRFNPRLQLVRCTKRASICLLVRSLACSCIMPDAIFHLNSMNVIVTSGRRHRLAG